MGHRSYLNAGFDNPRSQHNVMAFVGNGFDIQVLRDYGSPIDTRYIGFYHFLKLRSFNTKNPILQEMERLRDVGKENWSDVEGVVAQLLAASPVGAGELVKALRAIQGQFSEFLGLAVPSDLLTRLGTDSMDNGLAVDSLAGFLGDLQPKQYKRSGFPAEIGNFDVFNFVFVNFNYTSLLDDFIFLDQQQFDPLPFRTVDRNFVFEGNPRGVQGATVRSGDTFSSYVMTEVLHPHGHQSIPRSLLFGIDEPTQKRGNRDQTLRLAKPFWAQNERRYKHLFDDTELYIVFGCSLGIRPVVVAPHRRSTRPRSTTVRDMGVLPARADHLLAQRGDPGSDRNASPRAILEGGGRDGPPRCGRFHPRRPLRRVNGPLLAQYVPDTMNGG